MNRKKYYKHIIILISFVIVVSVLWNNYDFSKRFKYNERSKMEILAKAYDRFGTNNLNQDFSLEAKVIESNHDIPMIVTNELDVIVMSRNLDSLKMKNSSFLIEQLEIMKKENSPIVIDYLENKKYHIYYKDSDLLTRLQYYPLLLVLTLVFFSGVIYLALRSNKISEQNKLWVGMAKETAHQIGTPLSSLMGWIELMKLDNSVPPRFHHVKRGPRVYAASTPCQYSQNLSNAAGLHDESDVSSQWGNRGGGNTCHANSAGLVAGYARADGHKRGV